MRCLHRRVTRQGREGLEYHDTVVVSATILLGSAADQSIVLRDAGVSASHAEIVRRSRGVIEISAVDDAPMQINGTATGKVRLVCGDVVEIGGCRIEVLPTPPGFDLAVQIEGGGDQAVSAGSISSLADEGATGWFTKSRLSWLLATGILFVTFLVPVTGLMNSTVQDTLRDSGLLPSDKWWSTGPLAATHRIPEIGDDCSVCHAKPFEQVTNAACTECHEDIRQHVPADSNHAEVFADQSCMDCHKEHKEPALIVRSDQQLCTACHADAQALEGVEPVLETVSDFDDDHPDFRLTLLVPEQQADGVAWQSRRVVIGEPGLVEQSNLKFNHKVHLEPEGVEAPDGDRVMKCSDCHVDDAAGALMRPMTMEGQCRECHSLAFDEHAPERELPHAILADVIASLEEYYSRLGLEQQPDVKLADQRTRTARRPGRSLDSDAPGTVLDWAQREARLTAEDIFERTSCNTCHDIKRIDFDAETPEWEVAPVRLNDRWMPHARFSHREHTMQECTECHKAAESEESADVLMPAIEVCQDCHGGARSETRLKSTCMACHYLHNPEMDLLHAQSQPIR